MEFKIKLISKKNEALSTKTFYFEKPSDFSYIAGQYIYLTIPHLLRPDPRGDTRHFTLSSSPTEKYLSITVRMREGSFFKDSLDKADLGSVFLMRGPNGFFILDNTDDATQVMIAGGIGVTPYRSIIRSVADTGQSTSIHLVCSNPIPEEITFEEELDQIVKTHKNIKVTYTVTKPEESKQKWRGFTGRIDEKFLQKLASGNWKMENSFFWVCGPPLMSSAIEEVLERLGIKTDRVKTEHFTGY